MVLNQTQNIPNKKGRQISYERVTQTLEVQLQRASG